MANSTHAYHYRSRSRLEPGQGDRLLLLATSGGVSAGAPAVEPRLFTGALTAPEPTAAALLAVADIAAARYYRPGTAASRDPVVTCHADRLRFESFSGCCGVHARVDVLPGGFDGGAVTPGTTNIDVNTELRVALGRVTAGEALRLSVGPQDVTVTTSDAAIEEKKVPLPERWLRGFAEVQAITSAFDLRAELPGTAAFRFLQGCVRGPRAGVLWAVPSGRSLRATGRPVPGAVCLPGPDRLAVLLPLLRFARALRVYGPPVSAAGRPVASAWELDLGVLRIVLTLSPEPHRGFSGEGAVLGALAGEEAAADADLLAALLAFDPVLEIGRLAASSGLPAVRVRAALTALGTAGRVGYDLAEAAFFHRELPYDAARVDRMNPRLRTARALVESGAVAASGDLVTVTVGDHAQRVRFAADGSASCTCRWWTDYRGTRGRCSHVLAAEIARDAAQLAIGISSPGGMA